MGEPALVFSRESRFTVEPFETIRASTSPHLIKGVLPARGVGFLVGPSKAGKSFVGLDWNLRLAAGAPTIMGRKAKHVGSVYIGAEDPDGCRTRIEAWRKKWPRGSYTPFSFIGRALNLLDEDELAELIAELVNIAAVYADNDIRLGIVTFDTWSRCIPGAEENSSEGMSRALAALERVGRELDCLILAVAHHGKDGSKGIRGWSGLDAGSDATVTVERDEQGQRTLTLSKVKNGPDGAVVGFSLDRQTVGLIDDDGEEIWSCVVAYEGAVDKARTAKRRKALSASAEIVLGAIGRLVDKEQSRQPIPVGVEGVRSGTWAVRRADVNLDAATNGLSFEGEPPATYRKRFQRAVEELIGANRVRVFGDAIWLL